MTQPDITVACTDGFLRRAWSDTLPTAGYPTLERLSDACESLPAFVACRRGVEERPVGAR